MGGVPIKEAMEGESETSINPTVLIVPPYHNNACTIQGLPLSSWKNGSINPKLVGWCRYRQILVMRHLPHNNNNNNNNNNNVHPEKR
jgi:hypothetical protein